MSSWTYRMAVVAALLLCVVFTPGCCWQVQQVKIVNESEFPLTSVRLIPYRQGETVQDAAIDTTNNLLPKDASGHTIALAPGGEVRSWFLRKQDRYIRAVTFYADTAYNTYMQKSVLDLSDTPARAMLVIRVNGLAARP
ncbi:MAG: hypothetical protein BWY09_02562 [Candidatus Hydrogenedentes bacterium ADurb.Bin179]|mgnify:CR=1 FL=1|nr:MAG: hypothetical protein BWY09_02562 [Candidatus Hydrogenedentes bacterium ADurb.Bin179]